MRKRKWSAHSSSLPALWAAPSTFVFMTLLPYKDFDGTVKENF